MPPCPNCGRPVPDGKALCPNCGAEVKWVWPPTPSGQGPPAPPSGQVENGLGLGCLLSAPLYFGLGMRAVTWMVMPHNDPSDPAPPYFRHGTWTINLVPLALIGLLYFGLRPRYPAFARGLGYCLVVIMAMLLYGLATCRN